MILDLQILDFLDEFDVLLGKAGLVRGDVYDRAVQFFDLDVKFVDGYLQPLGVLHADEPLLGDILHLSEKFVNFSLELGLFLVGPEVQRQRWSIFKI